MHIAYAFITFLGSILENDFWTPPRPINNEQDHYFPSKLEYILGLG